jgi:hypothetical protein
MLYHREIGFPEISLPSGVFKLRYSEHARREARKETLELGLPPTLDTTCSVPVEIEVIKSKVIKVVYRLDYYGNKDLIIVASVVQYPWVVKTVWINYKNDNHSTLKRDRYVKPLQRMDNRIL